LVVFYSDHFLVFKDSENSQLDETRRFFEITERLPIELQMILCHRVYGHARDLISKKLSDAAFKLLTWKLIMSTTTTNKTTHL
jgi:hypothetical protein